MPTHLAAAETCAPRAAGRPARPQRRLIPVAAGLISVILTAFGLWRLALDLMPAPDLSVAERLIRQQKDGEAESLLRRLLEQSPDHGDARQTLARLLARRGNKRACADELHKVPFWWPGKRDTQFLEGQVYNELGLARKAEAAWMGCVTDDPLHPADPARVNGAAKSLVAQYMLTGRVDAARSVLWQAYAQASPAEKAAVLGTRVRVELERIDPVESIELLEKQVAADPDDTDALRALALAYQLAHRPAEADRLIDTLLHKAPLDLANHRTRVAILIDRNDPRVLADCVARLPAAVAQAPDVGIQLARAESLEAQGKLAEAAQALSLALSADPFDEEVHFRIARVAQRLGDRPDQAAEHRVIYQQLHRAREALPRVLSEFGALAGSPANTARRAELIEQLAALCETLGWKRLAREWRSVQ